MSSQWMPLYIGDYLRDTSHLTAAESGAYLHLIMHYWQVGSLPDDDRKLSRIARMTAEEWAEARPTIEEFFQHGWRHKRIDAELAKSADKSCKAKSAAEKRWHSEHDAGALREQCGRISERNAGGMLPQPQPQLDSSLRSESLSDPSLRSGSLVDADPAVDATEPIRINRKRERKSEEIELIQDVVSDWNSVAEVLRLPRVSHITPKRQAAVLARAKDLVEYYDFSDAKTGFRELFARIRGSPFLRGEKNGFRADFDFSVTQSSFTKIMEGKYESETKSTGYGYGH